MDTKNKDKCCCNSKDARQRLINAAEVLFADKGLDATSIRDLTTQANCSLALVNYHFGDKQVLYEELFRQRMQQMLKTRLAAIEAVMADEKKRSLEKLLREFAKAFLQPFTDRQASQRFMQLFAREMCEQCLPKGMFAQELAGPTLEAMCAAIDVLCPGLKKADAQKCIVSIIGQLVQVIHIQAMFEKEDSEQLPMFEIPKTVEHIVKFSIAGIRAYEAK